MKSADSNKPIPDSTPLMELSTAYWGSQALFTAIRLRLFEYLSKGPQRIDSLALLMATHPRSTRLLVNACSALGLISEEPDGFRNSELSQTYLVPGTDFYLGNSIRYSDDLFEIWAQLEASVKSAKPSIPPETYLGGKASNTEHFVYGMHNRALAIGGVLTNLVDLSECRQLLDIGAGPGTFSGLFVQRYPHLRAIALDLPDIAAIGKKIIKSMGVDANVDTLPGDYMTTDFPDNNDAVLISGVFHRESELTCQDLVKRAVISLTSNGILAIVDVFTDKGNTSPLFPTLFGLNMMLTAENGGVHADVDVENWMAAEGMIGTKIIPFPSPMPHRIVIGRKNNN